MATTVGCSKTSIAGRARPVATLSLLRTSTADRESKPISTKGRSASTDAASAWPSTSATVALTRSLSAIRRSSGDRSASVRRMSPWLAGAVAERSASRSRAWGSSSTSGRRRAAVYPARKVSQSTSATVSLVSSSSRARPSAATQSAGGIGTRPRRRSCCSPSGPTIPDSAQTPHATAVASSPRARRRSASASR